jgi:hypothetical protein
MGARIVHFGFASMAAIKIGDSRLERRDWRLEIRD